MYQSSSGSSRITWMLAGMAIGAMSMFVLDPAQGNRRRAAARDKITSAKSRVSNVAEKARSSLRGQANGMQRGTAATSNTHAMHAQEGAGTSAVVGAFGGTDAAAGAHLSGSKAGGPGGPSLRENIDSFGVPGTPGGMVQGDNISPGAGASAAGGTGLGSSATADDTRTGTGTESGSGTALVGGGMSGARDAGTSARKGSIPTP